MKDWSDLGGPMEDRNYRFVQRIMMTEVENALKRMKMGKTLSLNGITPLKFRSAWMIVMRVYTGSQTFSMNSLVLTKWLVSEGELL